GISDWGGISPVSIDYVNPKERWPTIAELRQITSENGFSLIERLPVYPKYIKVPWLSPSVYNTMQKYDLITEEGYRKH
ncbi:MAG: 7,8-didemethyl-8-hydroxy-5-deazariboflavin synthase subunit CofG, partial [Candidatus Heimdallarchaeota archaeon]|nr:7,8-didemethyl-8-hydroxy-5-deazariboflavin synthase subunit CofG [Candidatus Heimdallarchaeota archaeon]